MSAEDWTFLGIIVGCGVAMVLLLFLAYFVGVAEGRKGCRHCGDTIVALSDALDDARLTMLDRRHPSSPVHTWGVARHRAPRQRWMPWPGDHAGHLTHAYGDPLDPDRVLATTTEDDGFPAYRETAPYPAWLTEPAPQQYPPLDRGQLITERVIAAAGWEAPTRQEWVVRTRDLEVVR